MTDTNYSNFRWFIFVTMIIVTATTSMSMISPAPLIPALSQAMIDMDPGQVTWVTMGIFNFFLAIAAMLGGFLLDKLGVIKVFIGGLILILIGALLMPVIGSSYWGMMFNRLLQGLGTGPVMAAAAPIAASYFPMKERSIVTGAQGFSVALGIIIGLQVVPRLFSASGDAFSALRILAPVSILGLALSIVAIFSPKIQKKAPVTANTSSDNTGTKALFKKALLNPMTWIAIACFTLMSGIFQQFNSIVPSYIGADAPLGLGMGEIAAGNAATYATIFFCLGSFVSGFICEKVFKGNARPVIAIGFLIGAVFAFSTKYGFITSSYGLLVTVLIITGFFYSWVNPQSQAYIAKNYAQEITGKLGGLSMFVGILLGSTIAIWVLGKVLSATGNYMMPINIMAGLCVVGFIVSLFLKQKID
jgi:MFS family permease